MKIIILAITMLTLLFVISNSNAERKEMATDHKSIEFKNIKGESTSLNDFGGKVLLIVNVASKCGYTPQYKELEEVYRKYKEKGFVVIGFPANNFGNQEPGSDEDILAFCQSNFDVSFPMMSKVSAAGNDIHPIFHWLTSQKDLEGEVQWNFNKFIVDKHGNLVARFNSKVKPDASEVTKLIEALLASE